MIGLFTLLFGLLLPITHLNWKESLTSFHIYTFFVPGIKGGFTCKSRERIMHCIKLWINLSWLCPRDIISDDVSSWKDTLRQMTGKSICNHSYNIYHLSLYKNCISCNEIRLCDIRFLAIFYLVFFLDNWILVGFLLAISQESYI